MKYNKKPTIQYVQKSMFLLMLLALFFGKIYAQQPQRLTLGGAIQLALSENIDLKRSENAVKSGKVNIKQAKANFLPNLNVSASVSRQYSKNIDLQSDETSGQVNNSFSAGASSGVNLFNGFSDVASLKQSRFNLETDELDFERSRQTTLFETISVFLQAVLDSELIAIQNENLDAQRKQLALIQEFYNAGNRSLADVLQQKAAISQSELQALNTVRNYEISKYQLMLVLGQSPATAMEIVSPDIERLLPKLGENAGTAIFQPDNRPDLLAQRRQIDASSQGIRIAKAGYFPTLSLSFSTNSNYRTLSNIGDFSDQFFDLNPSFSIGLQLSVPLFDRFRTRYSVQLAKIQLSNQQLALKNLELDAQLQVRQARLNYQTALKQRDVARAQLASATEALKAVEERYNVGSSTFVELSQVRAQMLSAQNDRITADYNLLLSFMSLQFSTGDIDAAISIFDN